MTTKRTIRQVAVAVLLLVAFLFQGTWALAGTTGGLNGVVTDTNGKPVAGAEVKATSASQVASTTTDAGGHFVFLSLAPDTYTVAITKDGYQPIAFAGVSIFADQSQTLTFTMQSALKTIANVTSRAAGALVRAGTTSDVYSVNSATAAHVTGLGGGGGLDNAYSAIATVPGAFVPVGQAGWYQSVYIRGGDYDQVGYEVDGVPVNRSFDNYPSNTQSALGQQEVQVYTGSSPSNAEGQGLAGFINQVIKTGTYPGFADSDLGVGGPTFYHKANIEVGGATPDRLFSYYAGFGGYNQDYRYYDQNNGAGISSIWGPPIDWRIPNSASFVAGLSSTTNPTGFGNCGTNVDINNDVCYAASGGAYPSFGPGGFILGPYQYAALANIADRESVMNFHFAIPHKHDGGRDDLQLLYQVSHLISYNANAYNDFGSSAIADAATNGLSSLGLSDPLQAPFYGGLLYNGPLAAPYQTGKTSVYNFPSQPVLGNGGTIPNTLRDTSQNDVGIVKLQYQKNFGSSAYLRAYGYTVYSDWLLYGPQTTNANFVGPNPSDYELNAHTRGVSATFADQLNSKNLLSIQGAYTTATAIRDNNSTILDNGRTLAVAVPIANPLGGTCLGPDPSGGAAPVAQPCSGTEGGTPYHISFGAAAAGSTGAALPPGYEYLAVENGNHATYNNVTPKFTSGSITDEFDPTDRLHINLGLRYDRFEFDPQNTNIGPARNFWFNSWNNAMCVSSTPGSNPVSLFSTAAGQAAYEAGSTAANGGCAALGAGFNQALLTNNSATQAFTVVQPRVSFTYTVNPLNVLRFSYGKYDQAPNTAFEQYSTLQQDLPDLLGPTFYAYGRTSPTYPIAPEVSFNTDFSWEHQLKGTDMSFKLTPFYRKTQNQVEQFYLNQKTNFVSGLNVGTQTSSGVEFQLQKGDFSRNGFAALLSYTYTYASIKYNTLNNGGSIISPINQSISSYNAYTAACAPGGADVGKTQYGVALCGASLNPDGSSVYAAPCFSPTTPSGAGGLPVPCATGAIANPYYSAAAQGFLDPAGSYSPYDLFPAGLGGGSYSSFVAPSVATLVLNYKHDKFAITPALQFQSGTHYGFPIATDGFNPATCAGFLAGSPTGDPRYPSGAVGGSPADATTCANAIPIPNPATGHFDNLGSFVNPSRLTVSTQLSYDLSPRITTVLTLTNLVDTCFGGSKEAWTSAVGVPQNKICGYGAGGIGGEIAPVGNFYNPGATVQPFVAHSYGPAFGSLPFDAYLDFKIKL